jgi:hypothetical protein
MKRRIAPSVDGGHGVPTITPIGLGAPERLRRGSEVHRLEVPTMLADFWGDFFLLLIFLPLAMLWVFALVDIFRRHDMGGGSKALWVAIVIVIPFIGALVYIAMRPSVTSDAGRERYARAAHEFEQPPTG